jgi:hypothetical protein
MASRPLTNEEFAHRLRRAFDAKKAAERTAGNKSYGLRTLGRALDPDEPDKARRSVQRYLAADHQPLPNMRLRLAEELGCDPSHLGVVEMPRVGGGEMFADLLDEIAIARRHIDKLERQVVLLAETREGVAA